MRPRLLLALLALAAPALGEGRVTVHVPNLPASLNAALDGSAVTSQVLAEVHAFLLERDPDSLRLVPVLCREVVVEDALVLAADAPGELAERALRVELGGESARVLRGTVTGVSDGFEVADAAGEVLRVPAAAAARLERGTSFTLRLRDDVRWHDGHPFDARDVLFSRELYDNPDVRCDARRFLYAKLVHAEAPDAHTVRLLYAEQYFKAEEVFATLCLLPSHLYDLGDPDHPRHDADASQAERAAEINDNAHNREWVGLGPYRVKEWTDSAITAVRFPDWFDPLPEASLDELRWRRLSSDDVLRTALAAGEVDFSDRLDQRDLQALAADPELRTGRFHRGRYGFVAWNLRRGALADVRVRRALAHAFDFERFDASQYGGHALRVTGPQNPFGPGYDAGVEAPAYDLARAEELLVEAGWIDRDGDGRLDRDGTDLVVGLLVPAGNQPGARVATVLQEALAGIGVELDVATLDLGALLARVRTRDFDGVLLAWTQPVESDPESKWHSRWADVEGSSNLPGLADPTVDALIERGQRELVPEARFATWRELHRRLHELQPYLFLFNAPVGYALRRTVEGFEPTAAPPNYVLRRWRWVGEE